MDLFSSFSKVFTPKDIKKKPRTFPKKIKKTLPIVSPQKDLAEASSKAREIILDAKDQALQIRKNAEDESRKVREEVSKLQQQIARSEAQLEERQAQAQRQESQLSASREQIQNDKQEIQELKKKQIHKLEQVSKLTKDEARNKLLKELDDELAEEAAKRIRNSQ